MVTTGWRARDGATTDHDRYVDVARELVDDRGVRQHRNTNRHLPDGSPIVVLGEQGNCEIELRARPRDGDVVMGLALAHPDDAVALAVAVARAARRRAWRTTGARRSGQLSGIRRRFQRDLGRRFVAWKREGQRRFVMAVDGHSIVPVAIVEVPRVRREQDLAGPVVVRVLRPDLLVDRTRPRPCPRG